MAEQEYLTNQRDHDEFELVVKKNKATQRDVEVAALGYIARTILAKHRDARWLELDWGCEEPARLAPGDVLDENHCIIESCEDVDTDLYRIPSWLDEGAFLNRYTKRRGTSAYFLDLIKARDCYAPPAISRAVERKWKKEAQAQEAELSG